MDFGFPFFPFLFFPFLSFPGQTAFPLNCTVHMAVSFFLDGQIWLFVRFYQAEKGRTRRFRTYNCRYPFEKN